MKIKKSFHLYLIGALLVLFFVLIYASTSTKNVEVSYTFKDEITISSFGYQNAVNIGTLDVKSTKLFPTAIKVKNLKLCLLTENQTYGFDVNYAPKGIKNTYNEPLFYSGQTTKRVDVKSKEETSINIFVNPLRPYNLQTSDIVKNKGETVNLYLFEVKPEEEYYNYCQGADIKNSMKTIKTTLNIDENELEQIQY